MQETAVASELNAGLGLVVKRRWEECNELLNGLADEVCTDEK